MASAAQCCARNLSRSLDPKPKKALVGLPRSALYPQTHVAFTRRFSRENACLAYLERLRWDSGFVCPGCGHGKAWRLRPGVRQCQRCSRRVTVTAGTIFHRSRKPTRDWLDAIWHLCGQKNGGSALGLLHTAGFGSYHTAWEWLHRIRRAMVLPGRTKLSGEVEVDETFIGGVRSGKRGRGAACKTLVLIAVEVHGTVLGRVRLAVVPDATAGSLLAAVDELVAAGSNVVTDGWTGYAGLPQRGYKHTISRPTPQVGRNLLPKAHRVASLLKRWFLGTLQGSVGKARLQSYLDEFVFRFNRRSSGSRGLLFYRLTRQCLNHPPVPISKL